MQNSKADVAGAAGVRLVAAGVVLACLYLAGSLIITMVVAVLLVFVCDPFVSWLNRRLHLPRGLGAFLAVLLMLGVVYLAFYLSYAQITSFTDDLPKYSGKIRDHVLKFKKGVEHIQQTTRTLTGEAPVEATPEAASQPQTAPAETTRRGRRPQPQAPQQQPAPAQPQQRPEGSGFSTYLGAGLRSVTELVFLISFVPFLVFFMLTWKDHIRRTSISIFGLGNRMAAERAVDGITLMLRGFVLGNVVIGLILSAFSGLFFYVMKLPYSAIMGPVSGFLSLVPYLGVLLAALPPLLAAVGEYNTLGPVLVILAGVVGLHLFALNVLYPKLIGSRVHLNPVVVTIALMFWGWLWGAMGLVLAIPITGGFKAVCDNVPALKQYGRLMAD